MQKTLLLKIESLISASLSELGVTAPLVQLERTSSPEFGEYTTNAAMRYAKELKMAPIALAEILCEKLQVHAVPEVAQVDFVLPGFLNIRLSKEFLFSYVEEVVSLGDDFGSNQSLAGQKWVIEHTSPNPNKAMHLGHLRNNVLGMGLVRLLKKSGAEVTSDAIYNDRGIAIAKVMYGFLAQMRKSAATPVDVAHFVSQPTDWYTPADLSLRPDVFVEQCYVQAEEAVTNSKEIEQTIRQMVVDWEAKDENTWRLWEHVLQYAYAGQTATLTRLGSSWDKVWYEHEHYEKGKQYVEKGLEKGIFQSLEDGAVLTKLEETYSLPETILQKNDGTSLYITQDIALTDIKRTTYSADKLVWVVGGEQSLQLKQLFAVCEQLGIGKQEDYMHVPYGKVGLKSAEKGTFKMSSRAGTVVLIDDVIDGVKNTIAKKYSAATEEDTLAETLATGAVKFAFLKSDRMQDITFDVEQSIDVHGDSGMYVLYTYVRTQSILQKAQEQNVTPAHTAITTEGEEAAVVRSLLYFSEVIEKSVKDVSVHHIAQYILEICSEFNSWYAKEQVLDGSDRMAYKVLVTQAVGVCIKNALDILGIDTVEKI